MDSSRFDEFTKALATPASRRQALKTLAATAFGGVLALSGIGTAFAKKCPPGQTNCGGRCVDTTKDPNNCGMCGIVCVSIVYVALQVQTNAAIPAALRPAVARAHA